MEYTKEQAEQAIYKKQLAEMAKQVALWHHETAREWVSTLNLPYRVGLDYEKQRTQLDKMQIHLSEWYPLPTIPIIAELSKEEKTNHRQLELWALDDGKTWFELTTYDTGERTDDNKKIMGLCTCKDEQWQAEQKQIDEKARQKAKQYKPWNLETKQGLEQWEKYFALYIAPYESVIASWNGFNMFGDTNHSEKELNERKAYYIDLIKRFKADTVGYFEKEPRKKQVTDYDLYDFTHHSHCKGFYMWDGEMEQEHPQALQYMQKELALYEQLENSYEYYREIEKAKEIIRNLEQ